MSAVICRYCWGTGRIKGGVPKNHIGRRCTTHVNCVIRISDLRKGGMILMEFLDPSTDASMARPIMLEAKCQCGEVLKVPDVQGSAVFGQCVFRATHAGHDSIKLVDFASGAVPGPRVGR